MAVEIRRADHDDVVAVVAVRLAFLADEYDDPGLPDDAAFRGQVADFVERSVAADRWWSWLAEDDGSVVGGLSMLVQEVPPHPRDQRTLDGFVFNVWVEAAHRRKGIGRRLVDACLEAASTEGLRRVALMTTDDGRHLYDTAGFTSDPDHLRYRIPPSGS